MDAITRDIHRLRHYMDDYIVNWHYTSWQIIDRVSGQVLADDENLETALAAAIQECDDTKRYYARVYQLWKQYAKDQGYRNSHGVKFFAGKGFWAGSYDRGSVKLGNTMAEALAFLQSVVVKAVQHDAS